jgi:hypothetical protein
LGLIDERGDASEVESELSFFIDESKKKKKRVDEGFEKVRERQEMKETVIWRAFEQKIEVRMLFLHQLLFLSYLKRHPYQSIPPLDFNEEYKTVLHKNRRNLRIINHINNKHEETA